MKKKTKNQQKQPITVGFIALGCPKNVVDSEKMLSHIVQADMLISAEPSDADVVVVNTCGFIAPAAAEAMDAISQALKWKKQQKIRKVVVAGCLAQRLGEQLFEKAPGIDAIVGLGQRDHIADIIRGTLTGPTHRCYMQPAEIEIHDDCERLLISGGHSAYLRISEGCDHACTFCTIPAIRGKFRSKPLDKVIAEARELAEARVSEINIIAQDTAYYGRDLKMKDGLVTLLKELENIDGPQWLRLMYLYPVGITDSLVELVANSKRILHYFDLPIQHISNSVLRDMKRPDTKELISGLVEKLRSAIPDLVLRTTVIVGFPGETDEQFKELLDFIKWARFDALGGFRYYAEQGTPAAEMPNQVPDEIKAKRLETLMLAQQEIAFEKNKQLIGRTITCLMDSISSDGLGQSRYYGQAPEIDSLCIIENPTAQPGDFFEAKIIATHDYDLLCEPL